MSDNKVKHIFSYVLFAAVLFLALSNSIHNTEYVSNIAKAAIVPLFLIGIIDFFGKVRDKAKQIVTSQIDRNHADYCEAKTRCEDMEVIGGLEETEKYQNWQNAMEQKLSVRTFNDLVYIEIDKTYQWFLPTYIVISVFLFLSMLFAQSDKWIAILSQFNSDTITLWTFTLLLLDISFTETLANKLISKIEKRVKKKYTL
ncbi:hypothetical protein AALC25_14570 [Lachnospiraceae bacterium 29-84]